MDVEGTLYPSISLIKIGRDIMPTRQGWEGNYAYLLKINFALCFMIGEAHGWGTFPKIHILNITIFCEKKLRSC